MQKIKSYGMLLILCSACAWDSSKNTKPVSEGDNNPDKILASFELKEKKFDRFKEVTPIETPVPQVTVSAEKQGSVATKVESKVGKTPSLKKASEEKGKLPAKVAQATSVLTNSGPFDFSKMAIPKYPSDYPDDYKKYDLKALSWWQKFSPKVFPGEKIVLDLKYMNITAGRAFIYTMPEVSIGGIPSYHYHVKLKSAPFYKYIYELDNTLDSYISKARFLPIKYVLVQRESKQDVDDVQLFDSDEMKTYYRYRRVKKGTVKEESDDAYIPFLMQDSFSVLFFVRGLPLKTGDVYEFPVITRAKPWLIKAVVKGKEVLKTPDGPKNAIKIDAVTHYPGVLKKKGAVLFWFSDDEDRKILKFEAEVKIGAIEGIAVKGD